MKTEKVFKNLKIGNDNYFQDSINSEEKLDKMKTYSCIQNWVSTQNV